LDKFIDEKNSLFEDDVKEDKYLTQFKNMLTFVKEHHLIKDISINRKNRLLAIYIGTTLALKGNDTIERKDINLFTDDFIENAKSDGFEKLKENVELVKNTILG
jgi:hypothetical protein